MTNLQSRVAKLEAVLNPQGRVIVIPIFDDDTDEGALIYAGVDPSDIHSSDLVVGIKEFKDRPAQPPDAGWPTAKISPRV